MDSRDYEYKQVTKITTNQVPSSKLQKNSNILLGYMKYNLPLLILLLSSLLSFNECKQNILSPYENGDGPATSLYDFYLDRYSQFLDDSNNHDDKNGHDHYQEAKVLPTPSIDFIKEKRSKYTESFNGQTQKDHQHIKPARVYNFRVDRRHYNRDEPENDLFSPIFNLRSVELLPSSDGYVGGITYSDNLDSYQNDAQPADSSSYYSDLIDSGSGNYENLNAPEESSNLLEESIVHNNEYEHGSSIAPTPVQFQTPLSFSPTPDMIMNENNQAPYLNRRLPPLAVTAGQVWKYFIPSDTFMDEDGDLRRLKSTIVGKTNENGSLSSNNKSVSAVVTIPSDIAQYYSWVQYDASSQLLYGLPIESDIGKHELILIVSDRFGATSQEIIQIHVRQHQSSRAFTHQFLINHIQWEPEKFPSMVDALGELVKQLSTRVFMDKAFENFIVQYYTINDRASSTTTTTSSGSSTSGPDNERMSFNLAWSNTSIPIHPCTVGQIGNLFRSLVDTQFLRPDWSSDANRGSRMTPSISMLKILEPDFKPESISINLLGSCDSKELFKNNTLVEHDNSDSTPKVGMKIGRLTWTLGRPIAYRIPVETFTSDRGAYTTRDLQLSLHTIDGLTLDKDPKYDFIDFDQEGQVIFGLPVDQEDHAGQRELLITARHPKSGYKTREVFIINIESQDLTTINNRAFQMSLYFHSRIRSFGPQERVSLSQKVVAATTGILQGSSPENYGDKRSEQITIMSIAKNINRAQLAVQGNFEGEYIDITKFERKTELINSLDIKESNAPVYKYTWTNESIGHLGDCPVEVIKENILYSLEQSMLDFRAPLILGKISDDQNNKSDSTRFFERLRQYFEPELDLVHLRFEPLGACTKAMELHDVGNSDMADMIDRASGSDIELDQELNLPSVSQATIPKVDNEAGNEEYWSIVVLLVLVVTLIFVIIMFFMGMHTYKINQDKRFEMQVKLAQARQNSMYLSSMILANLASPNDLGSAAIPNGNRAFCTVQDEEKSSRKPVILDNERRLFTGSANGPRSMAHVQLDGSSIITTPVKQNSTVTLDSMASVGWQPPVMGLTVSPSALLYTPMEAKQRSMTLNRRSSAQRQMYLPPETINHSQSILTVASLAGPLQVIPQGQIPLVYAPALPLTNGPNPEVYNCASLQRNYQGALRLSPVKMISTNNQQSISEHEPQSMVMRQPNGIDNPNQEMTNGRMKSSSRSSSVSATTNSVISNLNHSPHR